MPETESYATHEDLFEQAHCALSNARAYADRLVAELREELALQQIERKARVNPADLPPDQLISYDQFAWALGPNALKRRTLERYGTDPAYSGKFVPGIRMSAGKPVLFKAGDVAAWIAKNLAGFEVSK